MLIHNHCSLSTKKINEIYSCIFDKNDLKNGIFFIFIVGRRPGYWLLGRKYMKKCLFRQYLVRAVTKYNLYLFCFRIFVNTAGVNSSVFHWKNCQIRLKKKILVAMETDLLTEEKGLLLFSTGHKENRHTVSEKSETYRFQPLW